MWDWIVWVFVGILALSGIAGILSLDTRGRSLLGLVLIVGAIICAITGVGDSWTPILLYLIGGSAFIIYNLIKWGQLRDYYWLWCMETDEFFGPFNNDIEMKLFQPPHYLPGGWQIFWIPAKDPLKATKIIRKWVKDAEKVLRKDPEYKDRMPK